MIKKVFVYDPTASDPLSAVRGVGRYLQILKENFSDQFKFVSDLGSVKTDPYNIFINPFFNFLQPPLTLKRIAHKQIAVIHDLIPLKYPAHFPSGIKGSINILSNKLALKNYDLIITDSQASKRDIINILRVHENKIRIIYPCLPKVFNQEGQRSKIKDQNENLDLNKNSKLKIENSFCLYVGDATWNKNLVNLAKAIEIAHVQCVFVGKVFIKDSLYKDCLYLNPWQKELKQFFSMTKSDKHFIFAGFVPDCELIKLYQQASFNILSSRDEGFGFSWLESANFACPSLLSAIPVLKEISGGNALFANPENPQDIAEKIKRINSDKILRNKIGTDAKKRSEFFSPEKFKKEFLSIL